MDLRAKHVGWVSSLFFPPGVPPVALHAGGAPLPAAHSNFSPAASVEEAGDAFGNRGALALRGTYPPLRLTTPALQ